MDIKVKEGWTKIREFFVQMDKRKKKTLALLLSLIVLVAIVIAVILNMKNPYEVLFTDLSAEDTASIVAYLDDNGVTDYRVQNSNTILIPKSQETQIKAALIMQGYPKSGFAYETYRSSVGNMSTESDRNIAYLQDLQDRMAAVIRCLDGVTEAVVTIVQEEDSRYILDSSNKIDASASIMVTMKTGSTLTNQMADAIRNLVARAVKGLNIENVVISDSYGNVYRDGNITSGSEDASYLKLKLEEVVSNNIRTQIMQVLSPIFGAENVLVGVSSTVDVSHVIGEKIEYTEPDWAADGSTGGEGIIGSKIYEEEIAKGDSSTDGGVAGTESNADISTYVESDTDDSDDTTYIRNKGENEYNVDTAREQVEKVAATVTDVTISVSINSNEQSSVNMDTLVEHVARASGISEQDQKDKISILLSPFYQEPTSSILPETNNINDWVIYGAIAGAIFLIILVLILILIMKRRKKKKAKQLSQLLEETEILTNPGPLGADVTALKTERGIELRKEVRKFAEDNPEMAAQILKTWLRGGDD